MPRIACIRSAVPKYDEKIVAKAMEKGFACKLNLARSIGWLSESEATSIHCLHKFRNTAYHQGLRHERLLHSLTTFYVITACTVLSGYKPSGWWLSSSDVIAYRAVKYIGGSREPDAFLAAWERLRSVAQSLRTDLIADLTADLESTIDDFDRALAFLSASGRGLTRDEQIVDSQAWHLVFTEKGRAFAAAIGCSDDMHPILIVERIAEAYPWPIKKDPVPSWEQQLDILRSERDEHAALNKYCQFMKRTDALRSAVRWSARELDREIQRRIDLARGK